MSVALLPMYDWPELRPATDAFWSALAAALADRGIDAPPALSRDRPSAALWRDPDLVLAQSCGADFISDLTAHVTPVAAPIYAAPGCEGPRYASWIVARAGASADRLEALEGRVAAVNSFGSFSGWWALREAGFAPERTRITTAHRLSARAVAEGEADFAAIDAVAYAHLERFEPETAGALVKLGRTRPHPAPPFIIAAARAREAELFRGALAVAIAQAAAADALLLRGVAPITAADYAPFRALAPQH